MALMEAMATKWALDRRFGEAVLWILRRCPNGADQQVACLEKYFSKLPYRREVGEIYRSPLAVVGDPKKGKPGVGGDCDDLSIALAAALIHISIPVRLEVAADQDGWGFHVRVRVGLPPTAPSEWIVVDPVWRSEREWAMADQKTKKAQSPRPRSSATATAASTTPQSKSCPGPRLGVWAFLFGMGVVLGFMISPMPAPCPPTGRRRRRTRRSKH